VYAARGVAKTGLREQSQFYHNAAFFSPETGAKKA